METILVVEDDPRVSEVVVEMLEQHGYTVLVAAGAESAFALVAQGEHIDLMLAEAGLAETRGTELGRMMIKLRPRLRVVYMSSFDGSEVEDLQLPFGTAFIRKPFSSTELLVLIRLTLAGPAPRDGCARP
jgi:DNA-binding response OmpR family regulator